MNQKPRLLSDATILELFNLKHEHVHSIDIKSCRHEINVSITLNVKEHRCPACDNMTQTIKGYTTKKILHAALTHLPCYIIYRARRYKCNVCHKTFNEHNPFSYKNKRLSALTVSNVIEALKNPHETFSTVAHRFNLSPTTVATLFDTHVCVSRRQLPEYLSVDEVYAFRSDRSDYVCVLVDAVNKTTVDLLPSRKKLDLLLYFRQIPLEERKRVKGICIDMWETYRIVAKQIFPNAFLTVDKYHIFQEFHRRYSQVRINIMNHTRPPANWKQTHDKVKYQAYDQRHKLYYLLKKFNWILMKNSNSQTTVSDDIKMGLLDPNVPKKYNSVIGRYLNYYDILDLMFQYSPELKEVYQLKVRLESFYAQASIHDAKNRLEDLIAFMWESDIKLMSDFSKTLISWKYEIINSFNLIEKHKKVIHPKTKSVTYETQMIYLNNALIENRNRIIKQIKNGGSGFKNWDRFRNRVLYVLNDDATYRIVQSDI